jgi:hypothetical protein
MTLDNGFTEPVTGGSWSSNNTSVATVNTSGTVTGIQGGSTTIDSPTVSAPEGGGIQCFQQDETVCPDEQWQAYGTATVYDSTPVITEISLSTWNADAATLGVTITGRNFGTNRPLLSFSPGTGIGYTLTSYGDTQIVANISVTAGTPTESVSVTVTNNGYGGNAFNGQSGGQSPTSSPVQANVQAACFAQLKYRAVYVGGVNSGRNHSFWYIQDSAGTQWIIDAGPSAPSGCPLNCGDLVDWITEGTVSSHFNTAPSLDSSSASTAWSLGPSSGQLCDQVALLFGFAEDWPPGGDPVPYVIDGSPNSNTFSHDAGNAAGFTNMTAPPTAPGW